MEAEKVASEARKVKVGKKYRPGSGSCMKVYWYPQIGPSCGSSLEALGI